jgi:hypothetical protein
MYALLSVDSFVQDAQNATAANVAIAATLINMSFIGFVF